MKKIFTASTVEEAKEIAVKEFGKSEDKITFEVIEEPKKGLFGKIKGEAKVEAEYNPTKTDVAVEYLENVISAMGIENVSISVEENEESASLEISGEGFEQLIADKPEVMDSLQYLASLACNKLDKEYYRINLDCNGFREKRKAQLEELARKIAQKVKKSGRSTALEPMNPYERRIIHSAVAEIEGVESKSKGEEPYRKVIISSTNPKKFNKGGYKKHGKRNSRPKKEFDISTSFEKDYKKPKPEDELNLGSGVYGKIDI